MEPLHRKITATADGSHTIALEEGGLTYHSRHGAVTESRHVFIEAGLLPAIERFGVSRLCIFEMGMGSGLNVLLTAIEAESHTIAIDYHTVETNPLTPDEAAQLNYCDQLQARNWMDFFVRLHQAPTDITVPLTPVFSLTKYLMPLEDLVACPLCHLVYFDAFAPAAQPHLWTTAIFEKIAAWMLPGALLATYCSKGAVRRAMQAAGLIVHKRTGPPGKREMVWAEKPSGTSGK